MKQLKPDDEQKKWGMTPEQDLADKIFEKILDVDRAKGEYKCHQRKKTY